MIKKVRTKKFENENQNMFDKNDSGLEGVVGPQKKIPPGGPPPPPRLGYPSYIPPDMAPHVKPPPPPISLVRNSRGGET